MDNSASTRLPVTAELQKGGAVLEFFISRLPIPSCLSSLDFSLREGGRDVEMEGWNLPKGVKGAELRFARKREGRQPTHSYLYLSSELPSTQRKVGGNNRTLSASFLPEKGKGF